MGDIKSAREIAMEKVEKLGEATEEERLKWKYVPEGEKLAARYLKQPFNLIAELGKYEKAAARCVRQSAGNVLIENINLPTSDLARKTNKRVMDGLRTLKSDKKGLEEVLSQIGNIFNHYVEQGEQQRRQAYERLKVEFENRVQQAVQQQLGLSLKTRIDVEKQPQFQEEWRRIQGQLDMQYLKLLEEYKQELRDIP
jgi:hypothetical protein